MSKRKEKEVTIKELTERLTDDYLRWKEIYDNGCNDPAWSDGTNIDLKRNHIIYGKKKIEELLGDKMWLYPDVYFYPTPAQLPFAYMTKPREIYGSQSREKLVYKELPYETVMSFDGYNAVRELYGDNIPLL